TTVVDRVVVAVGRRANLDGIGLETLGVALDERGMPPFDSTTMRIGDLPVFIAGDASNRAPLLHEAADEGHIAGRNALEDAPNCYRRRTPLGIVFVDPGVAFVGQRHAELEDSAAVGEIDFAHQGRARAAQRNYGLMRIYASRSDARVLGAEMCVPAAEHMGHLLALAIEQNLTVFDLLRLPFYHPVLEEGMRSALRELARQLGGSGGSDLADCEGYRCEALD
ncbi:MAG: dihydrolipoyl dehydrogenase, partial [Betaproteobacteria bacterium]